MAMQPCTALQGYQAATQGELSFPAGASMFVGQRLDQHWWAGTFNGAHGRIPATFIKINAAGAARAPQPSRPAAGYGGGGGGHPWDWGNIPRALAERELMGCNEGTFLVRGSETQKETFTISVVRGKVCGHVRIKHLPGGFGINDGDEPCKTIADLVERCRNQNLQSSMQHEGPHAKKVESRLIRKPLPRNQYAKDPVTTSARSHIAARKPKVQLSPQRPGFSAPGAFGGGSAAPDPFGAVLPAAEPPSPDKWVVPDSQMVTNKAFFAGVDTDNDGLVSGADVMKIFMASKIGKEDLATIWGLCDIDNSGMLNVEQFGLAMYIISEKVKGKPIPASLTANMIPPSCRGGAMGMASAAATATAPAPVVAQAAAAPAPDPFAPTSAAAAGGGGGAPDPFAPTGGGAAPDPFASAAPDPFAAGGDDDGGDDPFGGDDDDDGAATPPRVATPPPEPEPAAAPAPAAAGGAASIDKAMVPEVQQGVYVSLWEQATAGADVLSPAQAITFFKESGFENAVLGQIWTLADAEKKGKLSLPEFCVALKLIAVKQAGGNIAMADINIPAEVPQLGAFTAEALSVWAVCVPGGDTSQTCAGGTCAPVLMKSGIEQGELMKIWALVDSEGKNALDYRQFGQVLGLISQAQQNIPFDIGAVGPDTRAPAIQGLNA
eukprot:gene13037-32259_t